MRAGLLRVYTVWIALDSFVTFVVNLVFHLRALLHLWLQQGVRYNGVSARRELTYCSMNGNGTELQQVVHTHRTSSRSSWRRRLGTLNRQSTPSRLLPWPHSLIEVIISISVGSTVRVLALTHLKPIRYEVSQFQDGRGAASFRYRIRSEITVLTWKHWQALIRKASVSAQNLSNILWT